MSTTQLPRTVDSYKAEIAGYQRKIVLLTRDLRAMRRVIRKIKSTTPYDDIKEFCKHADKRATQTIKKFEGKK